MLRLFLGEQSEAELIEFLHGCEAETMDLAENDVGQLMVVYGFAPAEGGQAECVSSASNLSAREHVLEGVRQGATMNAQDRSQRVEMPVGSGDHRESDQEFIFDERGRRGVRMTFCKIGDA